MLDMHPDIVHVALIWAAEACQSHIVSKNEIPTKGGPSAVEKKRQMWQLHECSGQLRCEG